MELQVAQFISTIRVPWLDQVMLAISFMGVGVFPIIILILAIIYFYVKHHSFKDIILLILAILCSEFLGNFLKVLFSRPRPPLTLAVYHEIGYALPSNHALLSMTFYGLLLLFLLKRFPSKLHQTILISVFSLTILLIGISRVYLGVHWVSDVLAGWMVGLALITGFYWLHNNWNKVKKSLHL